MLPKIPTIAFEKVVIIQNTSVLQDENLAHRVSLIPLKINPHLLESAPEDCENGLNPNNTVVFTLKEKCTIKNNFDTHLLKQLRLEKHLIKSEQLHWICQEGQESFEFDPPRPVYGDIPIIRLNEGQEIELELYAVKNIGMEHAKWSPVSTAFYRLFPHIEFLNKIQGKDSRTLKKMCPSKVFDIEEIEGIETAVVMRPEACTMCRECIRDRDQWKKKKNKKYCSKKK